MKLHVNNLFKLAVVPCLILISYSVVCAQARICPCPKPPGGFAVCDEKQTVFCKIKNGELTTVCITTESSSPAEARANALSFILGKQVTVEEINNDTELRSFVISGGLRTANTAITFSVPADAATPNAPGNEKIKLKELPEVTNPVTIEKVERFSDPFPRILPGNRMTHSPPPPAN